MEVETNLGKIMTNRDRLILELDQLKDQESKIIKLATLGFIHKKFPFKFFLFLVNITIVLLSSDERSPSERASIIFLINVSIFLLFHLTLDLMLYSKGRLFLVHFINYEYKNSCKLHFIKPNYASLTLFDSKYPTGSSRINLYSLEANSDSYSCLLEIIENKLGINNEEG